VSNRTFLREIIGIIKKRGFVFSFLDKIDAISLPGYVPSNDDILLTRKMTTGIREVTFQVKVSGYHKNVNLRVTINSNL
jgi:hypothetical protein